MNKQCDIKGCTKDAKYGLFRNVGAYKKWVEVCPMHEESIGNENLRRVKQ